MQPTRRMVLPLSLVVVLLLASWSPGAEARQETNDNRQGPLPEASYAPHRPLFPWHYFTELPWEAFNAFRSFPEPTQWPWQCDPAYMHNTGPTPAEYEYRGEWDLTNGVLFAMPEWTFGCFMSDQRELIRASLETGAEVTILAAPHLIPNAERCLRSHGFTRSQIERINFAPVQVDSIWIRDYGPEFLSHGGDDSARALVGPTYFGTTPRPDNCRPYERGPMTFGRDRDDASPTRLAELVQDGRLELRGVASAEVFRPPLVFEGGNIFSDGAGTCVRNREDTNLDNTPAFFWSFPGSESVDGWWNYDPHEIDTLISEYYNCDVVVLESMRPTVAEVLGGVIDHVDMTVTFLSSDTVLVGDYGYRTVDGDYLTLSGDGPDDSLNAAILDGNAQLLEALGYRVVRIPMPVPHCTRGFNCALDPERDLTGETIIPCPEGVHDADGRFVGGADPGTGLPFLRNWATFANSIRIGDSLMMPSYQATADALPSDHQAVLKAQEAETQRVYQAELDRLYGAGEIRVVPVPSDGLAACNGSLQCITKTY
jgi:agmatine/peptidylarginine deiminase